MVDDVKGLREMTRVLKKLPDKVRKRVVNASLREGARVVQDAAINNAISNFQGEGTLATGIKTARGRPRRFGELRHRVGVSGGARAPAELRPGTARKSRKNTVSTGFVGFDGSDGWLYYWRFLEFGTSKMPARPFLRPAGQSTVVQQTIAIRRILKRGIEREARKLAR